MRDDDYIPEGLEFLKYVETRANSLYDMARASLIAEEPLRSTIERVGTLLSLLDRAASCWWGCDGGSHLLHYLVMRGCSTTNAGIRLVAAGYYDEALSLARNVAEVGNLLWLFAVAPKELETWAKSSKPERIRLYSPRAVRVAIEKSGAPVPIDEATYANLCEVATHATPQTTPQVHAPGQRPMTGGLRHNTAGMKRAVNNLALALCAVGSGAARLLPMPEEKFRLTNEATIELIEYVNVEVEESCCGGKSPDEGGANYGQR